MVHASWYREQPRAAYWVEAQMERVLAAARSRRLVWSQEMAEAGGICTATMYRLGNRGVV